MDLGTRSTRERGWRILARTKGHAARSRRHATLVWCRALITLGLFVVYPACASVQREGSTRVLAHGSGGVTGDSSFDCDGTRTGTVEHTQVGAGGEVVRQTRGALAGGGRAEVIWGHVPDSALGAGSDASDTSYVLGNAGAFVSGDWEYWGHELGLGMTFQLDQRDRLLPSPWYRLRYGRLDVLFAELTAGSRHGFLLDQSLAAFALGLPVPFGTVRLGVRWGGRAVSDVDPGGSDGLFLARNSLDGGDWSGYLEVTARLSEKVGLFASLEAGGQLPAVRLGVVIHLDDAPQTGASEASVPVLVPDDEWGEEPDDASRQQPTPTDASELTAPRPPR